MDNTQFAEDMLNKVINDPATQDIIKENIQKAIASSIESSFRYGDLHNAIEKKIKEILVPYIEDYDISEYLPKLETVLVDIVSSTSLADNKKILENFKELMIEPEKKFISLKEIFDKYCEYMADEVNTDELEVDFSDGVSYQPFECTCTCENTTPSWSDTTRYDVEFSSETPANDEDETKFHITLRRDTYEKQECYYFGFADETSISNLKHLNKFEVYLLKLARAYVKIIDVDDYSEDVTPTKEPEPTFL